MLFESLILMFLLELYASPLQAAAAAKSPEHYFRLLNMDGPIRSNNFLIHNPKVERRPSPSDHLPIEDLIENENSIYDPLPSDINIKHLKRQLGRYYDKRYMSIHRPNFRRHKKFSISFKKGRPVGKRPKFLKRLRSARLQDGRKLRLDVSKKDRRKFQKYIWSLTFCPVKQVWKNLGIRFWPQWMKEGSCSSERSCSIPEGMKCKPSASTSKTFLRWHCLDFKSRKSCKWIPIQYPIITACSCIC